VVDHSICRLGEKEVPRTEERQKNNLGMAQSSLAPALEVVGEAVPAQPATPMPEGLAPMGSGVNRRAQRVENKNKRGSSFCWDLHLRGAS